jgi:hypothetical protein
VLGSLNRDFYDGLAGTGGQWLVSVLAFWEYRKGLKPTNFERIAVSAGKRLTN